MSSWREKIERIFNAVAFAEAGEHDMAREMMGPVKTRPVSLEDMMVAATFAEANEHDTARSFLGGRKPRGLRPVKAQAGLKDFLSSVGLAEVNVRYVTASI